TAYYILPTAYCLLRTAYCLLSQLPHRHISCKTNSEKKRVGRRSPTRHLAHESKYLARSSPERFSWGVLSPLRTEVSGEFVVKPRHKTGGQLTCPIPWMNCVQLPYTNRTLKLVLLESVQHFSILTLAPSLGSFAWTTSRDRRFRTFTNIRGPASPRVWRSLGIRCSPGKALPGPKRPESRAIR